jgi:hypothetical protein
MFTITRITATENAGKSRIYGVETDVIAKIPAVGTNEEYARSRN